MKKLALVTLFTVFVLGVFSEYLVAREILFDNMPGLSVTELPDVTKLELEYTEDKKDWGIILFVNRTYTLPFDGYSDPERVARSKALPWTPEKEDVWLWSIQDSEGRGHQFAAFSDGQIFPTGILPFDYKIVEVINGKLKAIEITILDRRMKVRDRRVFRSSDNNNN